MDWSTARARFHAYRGNVLDGLGRRKAALRAFDAAIRARPDVDSLHFNRGLLLQFYDRHAEALEAFDAAIELRPR